MIVRDLPEPAWQWAERLNRLGLDGLVEAYASYNTVGLDIDPGIFLWDSALNAESTSYEPEDQILHRIPVCYELGEDFLVSADRLGVAPDEFIRIHSSATYRCDAVGFCPGFPYLSGLPEPLCGIPRLPAPRTQIEPGSVAITGIQCGIYPLLRPGGWTLIGRTPLEIVHVADGYFPIKSGDRVQFTPIDSLEFKRMRGERL